MFRHLRRHNRENFYKYVPADTAVKVLQSTMLRWSSPVRFNDPFDVPRDIAHGYKSDDITRAVVELLEAYLDSPPEDLTGFDDSLSAVLAMARNGFSPNLRAQISSAIIEMATEMGSSGVGLQALREFWAALVPTLRILCLTESPSHVVMWHHYADCYRGAVLGFRCNDEAENVFLMAEPIEYLKAKPAIYTDQGLARLLCLKANIAARETFRLATYTKSEDWSYEREWRLVSYSDEGDPEDYTDWGFCREDLSHLYIGPLISPTHREQLVRLASFYPCVSVYSVSVGLDRELHFHKYEG